MVYWQGATLSAVAFPATDRHLPFLDEDGL
jgi:hypothetical protein